MLEIERKFLVNTSDFIAESTRHYTIKQGFLNTHPERTVRIRLQGDSGFITVKGKPSNSHLSRFEWEKNISKEEAEALLRLCEKGIIEKTRYEVQKEAHTFEIDVFEGENKHLIVAEVELNSETEAFIKPDWLGKEVTGDVRYYNSQLSKTPFNIWKHED